MPKWLDRILGREQSLPAVQAEAWPENVPVTAETIQEIGKTHHIFLRNREGFHLPVYDDGDEFDGQFLRDSRSERLASEREEHWEAARQVCRAQPHCKRALSLYVSYVFGSEFNITLKPIEGESDSEQHKKIAKAADKFWKKTLKANRKHWGPNEFARRTYRDGEQFTRIYEPDKDSETFQFRFIDPERIKGDEDNETKGIVTSDTDIATVLEYELYDEDAGRVVERISAEEMIHTKIDCDSTEKRGISRFVSVLRLAKMLQSFTENEFIHRNLQSSIVLVRKVDGPASGARMLLDNAKTGTTQYPEGGISREKIRNGVILTTHRGVDVEFAQPKSDFSDASPLGQFMIAQIATATGWTYSMLASEGGSANHATALVQESPTLQMVYEERAFMRGEWEDIYTRVLSYHADKGDIEGVSSAEELWTVYEPDFRYGDVVSRDKLKDAQTINLGVMNQTISRREGARRMGADPDRMMREIEEESKLPMFNQNFQNQNPNLGDKQASSSSNANDGGGTNQGSNDTGGHSDRLA